jgi:hypothetical protein
VVDRRPRSAITVAREASEEVSATMSTERRADERAEWSIADIAQRRPRSPAKRARR